ncbi:MAG: NUDIX hydrolase [Chloroflexota bacterium]|nr:NUDIX hydrolase [Chloroflexota bacterium]
MAKGDGAEVVLYKGDQVLLQKRTRWRKRELGEPPEDMNQPFTFPCHWVLFGGEVKEGETSEAAVRRELTTELGPRSLPLTIRLLGTARVLRGDEHRQVYFYEAPLSCDLSDLALKEGDGFALFSLEELPHLRMRPEDRLAIERFYGRQGFGWASVPAP